jgi:hypothetical protein
VTYVLAQADQVLFEIPVKLDFHVSLNHYAVVNDFEDVEIEFVFPY